MLVPHMIIKVITTVKSSRTYHSWIVYLGVAVSGDLEMFCPDKSICCTIGDSYTNTNYSTVICTNKILTAVMTLMIIWGASMHDQSSYKCGECGETFDNERTLSEHVGRSHEVNRDKCERCGENIQEQQNTEWQRINYWWERSYIKCCWKRCGDD